MTQIVRISTDLIRVNPPNPYHSGLFLFIGRVLVIMCFGSIRCVVEGLCFEFKSQQFDRSQGRILKLFPLTGAEPNSLSHIKIYTSLNPFQLRLS